MTGSEPQEAREVRDLLTRLARDVEPDLAQGEARIGARLHEGASVPLEEPRSSPRRSLALVAAAAAIVVVALVVGVVALVGDNDRVETTPAEGGPAGREVLFSAPGGPVEVMDAYLEDRFGGAMDHVTVVPPRSLGGDETMEGRWVTADPAGPGGTDIEAGAPPLFGGAVHLEPGPGEAWDVVRSDTAAVTIVDLAHVRGSVSGTAQWGSGPAMPDARLEVRDLAGDLIRTAARDADPGDGPSCEPCELHFEIPDVGDATVIVRFQLHVGGVPVSLTEVLLRSGEAHFTTTTTAAPPVTVDDGAGSDVIDPRPVTGDDPLGLAAGVVSVGVTSWNPDRVLWPVDDRDLAVAVVDRLANARHDDTVPEPQGGDRAMLVIELADGQRLVQGIELRSGWVEPGYSIGADLGEPLAAGFDEAVSSPWQVEDLASDSFLAGVVNEAGGPFGSPDAALEAIVDVFMTRRELLEFETYVGRIVEHDRPDSSAVMFVQHRGVGDDSVRGLDYGLVLEPRPDGWVVAEATERWLCRRSVPSPPDYSCL